MSDLFLKYYLRAKVGLDDFLRNEEGDVNVASIVVLIGIAVLLAVYFKDEIGKLLKKLFTTITGSSTNAISTKVNP